MVFFCGGVPSAQIQLSRNPFHGKNCYVQFQLLRTAFPPGELFSLLRSEAGSPLQVMAEPLDPVVPFLLEGGFHRRRRCYEMEVTRTVWTGPPEKCVPLTACGQGENGYVACCQALYRYYSKTHKAVSPLTAGEAEFFSALPEEAVFQMRDGRLIHFAFVEGNEIAYVGTKEERTFPSFAQNLAARQFRMFETLCFECDDCDPAAMALRALFHTEEKRVLDTYIFG